MKIFLVNWATKHGETVDSGSIACATLESAVKELDELYEASKSLVNCGYVDKTLRCYYVEDGEDSRDWERAEIIETYVNGNSVPVVTVSESDLKELQIIPEGAEVSYRQLEEVAALMEQMYSDDFSENLCQAWKKVAKVRLPVAKTDLEEVVRKNREAARQALELSGYTISFEIEDGGTPVPITVEFPDSIYYALVTAITINDDGEFELLITDEKSDDKTTVTTECVSNEDENRVLTAAIRIYNEKLEALQ